MYITISRIPCSNHSLPALPISSNSSNTCNLLLRPRHRRLLLPNLARAIPRNHADPQERTQTTKHQRHDAPGLEPCRQRRRRLMRPTQVEQINRIARGIAFGRQLLGNAAINVIARDTDGFLQDIGGFNHGGDQARGNVPFDMAVEEPDARVVGAETNDEVAVGSDHEGVAAHGDGGEGLVADVVAGFLLGADDGLEVVAVEVEGVLARVVVVEDDFDDLVLLEDEGVGVGGVDGGVEGGGAGRQGGVEGGHFGADVGDVVEEGVVGAVAEVVHCDVEVEGVVDSVPEGLFVSGDEGKVVKRVEGVKESRGGVGDRGIVHEPASDVGVE